MLKLQLVEDPDRYVKLTTLPITIGRDDGNDLAVNDSSISDFHAEVTESAGDLFVSDLLSASGTFVNEQRVVAPTRLRAWDVIRIGTVKFEIYDPNIPRPDHWALRSESDLLAGQFYTLGEKTLVGRDAECDLVIDWHLLSRRHAQLTIEDDHLRIEDLSSRNGTFVNGERVEQGVAHPGDEIRFDEQCFIVVGPNEQDHGESDDDDKTLLRGADPDQTVLALASRKNAVSNPDNGNDLDAVTSTDDLHAGNLEQTAEPAGNAENTVLLQPAVDSVSAGACEAYLTEQLADGEPVRWALSKEGSSIGRARENDIVLDDESVSKQHASIIFHSVHWCISDNGSRNGVRVNGEVVKEQPLRSGDTVSLGSRNLGFHCEDAGLLDQHETVLFSPEPDEAETRVFVAPGSQAAGHDSPQGSPPSGDRGHLEHKSGWLAGTALFLVLALAAGALYLWRTG